MSLAGMLSMIPLEEVLEWIESGSKTGALQLENEHFRKVLYFIEGMLVGFHSTEPADSLAVRLEQGGLLSPEQADAAGFVQKRTGRAFVDVLHKTGAVGDVDLEKAIDDQARQAIWAMFLWSDARFRFRDGEMPEDLPATVSFRVTELRAEGRRQAQRSRAIRARLPHPDAPFRLAVDTFEIPTSSALEEQVARLLVEPQTVLSLMLTARAGELDLLEALDSLLDQQALEFRPGEEAPTAVLRHAGRAAAAVEAGEDTLARASVETAVGVVDGVMTPLPVRPAAKDLLKRARREMERKHYDLALDLFRQAERADPQDARLPVLRAGAESVYSEVLYGDELPAGSRPVVMRPAERIRGSQGELMTRLLGQVNGALTVRDLAGGSGVTEVDALIALRELKRAGYIDLRS